MSITRRDLLRSTGLLAGGSLLAAESKTVGVPAVAGTDSAVLADVFDYARAAPAHMSAMGWEYINGGAADELTMRWNHEAYERLRLRTRVLVDISNLDTRTTLLGRQH